MRRFLFRTVSQIGIQYRDSPLSEGAAGSVRGGDRLPWVETGPNEDNFAPLTSLAWQVHVYGEPRPGLADACAELGLPIHAFAWTPEMKRPVLSAVRSTWFGRMDMSHWPTVLAMPRPWPAISPHTICAALSARHARASLSEIYAV